MIASIQIARVLISIVAGTVALPAAAAAPQGCVLYLRRWNQAAGDVLASLFFPRSREAGVRATVG
jgi:hypothetical protein